MVVACAGTPPPRLSCSECRQVCDGGQIESSAPASAPTTTAPTSLPDQNSSRVTTTAQVGSEATPGGDGSCASPFHLSAGGGSVTGKMNGDGVSQGSCGYDEGVDRHYLWTAPRSGVAKVEVTTDFWPAALYVLAGECGGAEQACTSTGGTWPHLAMSFPAAVQARYLIVVDAQYAGPITLAYTLTVTPPP